MGYYTDYTLNVQPHEGDAKCIDAIAKLIENEVEKIGIFGDGSVSDGWYANAKWYDYHEDMTLLSKKFPNVIFYLEGMEKTVKISGEDIISMAWLCMVPLL